MHKLNVKRTPGAATPPTTKKFTREPVWPSGKTIGWKADDVGSISTLRLSFLL